MNDLRKLAEDFLAATDTYIDGLNTDPHERPDVGYGTSLTSQLREDADRERVARTRRAFLAAADLNGGDIHADREAAHDIVSAARSSSKVETGVEK